MKIPYFTARSRKNGLNWARWPSTLQEGQVPLSAWLLRPFLDLGPLHEGPLLAQGVEWAFEQALRPELPILPSQYHPSPQLRSALATELHLPAYASPEPADLPQELRSERWQHLCEWLARWSGLSREQQYRVVALLNRMGLYQVTLRLVPPIPPADVAADPWIARLAAKRDMAHHRLFPNSPEHHQLLEAIATTAPREGFLRLTASLSLLVYHARTTKDMAQIDHWARLARDEFERLPMDSDPIAVLQASTYYRAIAFIPYLTGDRALLAQYIHRAEELAMAIPVDTPDMAFVAAENWHPLLETSSKCALSMGDDQLALTYARRLLEHDPLDPKVHMQWGDLMRAGKRWDEAFAAYRQAARLGAPFTGYARYMAGLCLEEQGEPAGACEWYLLSLEVEPGAVTPLTRLKAAAARCGRTYLAVYADARLAGKPAQRHAAAPA